MFSHESIGGMVLLNDRRQRSALLEKMGK